MQRAGGVGLLIFLIATIAWHFLFSFGWWQSLFLGCLTGAVLAALLAIWVDLDQLSRHFGQKG
jgi:hypothetical protein